MSETQVILFGKHKSKTVLDLLTSDPKFILWLSRQPWLSRSELDAHASRLKFYADQSLNVNEEILEHVAAQGIILAISQLKKHRWNSTIKDYEILVGWRGLESIEDSWEPLTSLAKEVKVLLNQYIQKQDAKVRKYWNDNCSKI
ncbi:hypothetical protein F444_02123 [Phytophthora nicotianae P1976]|uniref:Chromo domain-containing protein n=1 Tax=Phytophthora nicotianae P1976 TaxID=1317066 RepID=A0A081AYG6_PHYNI|nr:hypothetical protein F444_02123 [Phytophthora nicotianae P1976]